MFKFQKNRIYIGLFIIGFVVVSLFFTRREFYSLPHWSSEISIASCGATANDSSDDYQAIMACAAKAKAQGKGIYVPIGNFMTSNIITLDGVSMKGAGEALSVITSTNPERGSIDIKGDQVTLSQFKHVYQSSVPRGDGADEKNSITVRGATNFVIDHLHIDKSSTAGILVRDAASNGIIAHNTIESTGADGIHITDGSNQIAIENNLVKGVGDDTIAVVSYMADGPVARHITIKDNDVGYNSQARGISVVGGEDVLIEGNMIQETQMAGVYISVEEEWKTSDTSRITINKNTVTNTGIREPENHPNVLVYASRGKLSDIRFNDNIIQNAAHDGIGVWGDGSIEDIHFNSNILSGSKDSPTIFKSGKVLLNQNKGF